MTRRAPAPVDGPTGSAPERSRSGASDDAPRRRRARRGQGDLLREEILEAATELLVDGGDPDAVSTRAVARRVGCSSPSIYLHFPDRDAMLYAVCERQFDELGAVLSAAGEGIDDPIDRLRSFGRAYCRFALDHPAEYQAMMLGDLGNASYSQTIEGLRQETGFDIVINALEQGIEAGVVAPGEPTVMALGLWATCHGLVSLLVAKPGIDWPSVDALIDVLLDQACDGFRARPEEAPAPTRKRRAPAKSGGSRTGRPGAASPAR